MTGTPLVLELDLTQGFIEDAVHDPLTLALARRRPQLRDVLDGLRRAGRDPSVRALIARIGHWRHGLGWAAEVREAIVGFRRSGKPAIAFAESLGELGPATVPYFVATGFDEIWVQESGDVTVTGLAAEVTFLRGALDKAGIEPQLAQRYEYKNAANILTERGFTDAHREATARLVESASAEIVAAIAAARGLSVERVRELVDAAPLTATQAHDAGLIDHLGYRDQVYASVRERVRRDGGEPRLRFLPRYAKQGPRAVMRRLATRGRPGVALIHGTGAIRVGRSGRGPLTDPAMGSETVSAAFRAAVRSDAVRAIVFRVDSPGGSYVASDTIRREVELARKAGKPVIVSMGDMAASGGYFVSMPADVIVAQPGSLTGSIGVLGGKGVVSDLLDRLGIAGDAVAEGEHALMFSARRAYTEEEWARLEESLDRIYEDFTAKVAAHRGLDRERVHEIARGRVWTGADAAERGLVDSLGGLDVAADLARQKARLAADAPLRPFPAVSPLDRLRPAQSSDDPRAAAATAWSLGWGSFASIAAWLGLPPAGPLSLPYGITLR